MNTTEMELPVPVARGVMDLLPGKVLGRMVSTLMLKMARRHPRLFQNLERLDRAVVFIEPTDLSHDFTLSFGGGGPTLLQVDAFALDPPSAHIKGTLEALLDMLEGRTDGDMMFFSRRLVVEGKTEVIVGLRNTLDREGLHVMEDILSLFGPFSKPAGIATQMAGRFLTRVRDVVQKKHASLHDGEDVSSLRSEINRLKERLSKMEKAST